MPTRAIGRHFAFCARTPADSGGSVEQRRSGHRVACGPPHASLCVYGRGCQAPDIADRAIPWRIRVRSCSACRPPHEPGKDCREAPARVNVRAGRPSCDRFGGRRRPLGSFLPGAPPENQCLPAPMGTNYRRRRSGAPAGPPRGRVVPAGGWANAPVTPRTWLPPLPRAWHLVLGLLP